MRWLDPDGVRTLQSLGQHDHPLRDLWPVGGSLPDGVAGADPQILRGLLAACYATDLAWCRLAGTAPPRPGFTVPAALMDTILAGPDPGPGSNLTPWEIIEAARAHLAEQRQADADAEAPQEPAREAQPATTAWPADEPASDPGRPSPARRARPGTDPGASQPGTTAWPGAGAAPGRDEPLPGAAHRRPPADPVLVRAADPPPRPSPPERRGPGIEGVRAYGMAFLPGKDDIERLLTELRRRGTWARSLQGQEVSSAWAPAVLLVGDDLLRAAPPDPHDRVGARRGGGRQRRGAHPRRQGSGRDRPAAAPLKITGDTLLIEGLDALVLDDDRGAAYASALYRSPPGVTSTAIAATCAPGRLHALTEASPELVTDFRSVRLRDLSEPGTRAELATLLAAERHLELTSEAWEVARGDLAALRGRGRLTNARLMKAYLDRACSRHLSRAGETQVFRGRRDALTRRTSRASRRLEA